MLWILLISFFYENDYSNHTKKLILFFYPHNPSLFDFSCVLVSQFLSLFIISHDNHWKGFLKQKNKFIIESLIFKNILLIKELFNMQNLVKSKFKIVFLMTSINWIFHPWEISVFWNISVGHFKYLLKINLFL